MQSRLDLKIGTSDSVTIKSRRILKDKLSRSVGREFSGTYLHKDHPQPADKRTERSPRVFRKFVIFL